jgi:hypothetical protein
LFGKNRVFLQKPGFSTFSTESIMNAKIRYFTIEEANELLPTLEPLVEELLERRARVVHLSETQQSLLSDRFSDVGGPVLADMTQEFMIIEELVQRIVAYGCVLKDINVGLIDFLAEKDGREVFLCWRYGEPRIEYYHELHTGFQGRQLY